MKLQAFRVHNFRNINDSGWVEVGDIVALVGRNETGKRALLQALNKLNPVNPDEFNIHRDWPRSKRAAMDPDAAALQAKFALNDAEMDELRQKHGVELKDSAVFAVQSYRGEVVFRKSDGARAGAIDQSAFKQQILQLFNPIGQTSDFFTEALTAARSGAQTTVGGADELGLTEVQKLIEDAAAMREKAMYGKDFETLNRLTDGLERAAAIIKSNNRDFEPQVEETFKRWTPQFHCVAADIQRHFSDKLDLNSAAKRINNAKRGLHELQWAMIFDIAGVNLADEAQRTDAKAQEQRLLDFKDASNRLNKAVKLYWSQNEYVCQLQPNGAAVDLFVNAKNADFTLRFDEHSEGFRRFFLLEINLTYHLKNHSNLVLLLDQPDAALHRETQSALFKQLGRHANHCQIIYSTHSPFMVNDEFIHNVREVTQADRRDGARVSPYDADADNELIINRAKPEEIAPIERADGELTFGAFAVYVETLTEFWIINALAARMRGGAYATLADNIIVIPVKDIAVPLVNEHNSVILAAKSKNKGALAKLRAPTITYAEIIQTDAPAQIEDLLSPEIYLDCFNRAYSEALSFTRLSAARIEKFADLPNIVQRIEAALREINPDAKVAGVRQTVARRLLDEINNLTAEQLPIDTVKNFIALFEKINAHFAAKQQPQQADQSDEPPSAA